MGDDEVDEIMEKQVSRHFYHTTTDESLLCLILLLRLLRQRQHGVHKYEM